MTVLIRLCINAAALWAAVRLVPGVRRQHSAVDVRVAVQRHPP
jgi:hypothetical protein